MSPIEALYRAPLDQFVAERKRLAGELKAAGDKTGAKELLARGKPTVSAWAVNQLWWREREAFEALLASAEKLRTGDLSVTAAHRDTLSYLRRQAAAILAADGHGAGDEVLRRITATLNGVSGTGGFDPDPPGALTEDREPPGFDALALSLAAAPEPKPKPAPEPPKEDPKVREEAERRAREEAQRKERIRLEAALRAAEDDLEAREAEVGELTRRLREARAAAEAARARIAELERAKMEL